MSVKEEELLEEISGFLHGYLKSGTIKINSFLSKINPNISNLQQLLTIRFLLKEDTIQFVKDLPHLIKNFKTTTVLKNDVHFGEIRGQIDWNETIKERLSINYFDKTIFSTNESVRSYNTPENLVLKELLIILYSILFENDYIKGFEKSKWFQDWQELKGSIQHTLRKNIYLQRVDYKQVSDRSVTKLINHRNQLYRNAAKLLLTYRSLMEGQFSQKDLEVLLRETFIAPDNVDVLFELYWVVQVIKQNSENSTLHLLDGTQNMVASWEKEEYLYQIYHDSCGSGIVKFNVEASEIAESEHPYLKQKYNSFTTSRLLAKSIFGRNKENSIWRGRPDFLVEVFHKHTNVLISLTIGEVKNTANIDYAITGMEELLDYIYLVKKNNSDYLIELGIPIRGILCVGDDVRFNTDVEHELLKVVNRGKNVNIFNRAVNI